MAQIDAMKRYVKSNSGGTSEHTMDQLLHGDDRTQQTSPTLSKNHDQEEHDHPGKKSVLTKVKEKAKKLRNSFNKKKQGNDDNVTPTLGASLDEEDGYEEDDDEEKLDSEYYGAPMYESEKAPEDVKETARQHPRDDVISEKHVLPNSISPHKVQEEDTGSKKTTESLTEKLASSALNARMTIAEYLAPHGPTPENAMDIKASTETFASPEPMTTRKTITECLGSNAPMSTSNTKTESHASHKALNTRNTTTESLPPHEVKTTSKPLKDSLAPLEAMNTNMTLTESVTETLAPAYAKASEATHMITSKIQDMAIATSDAITAKDETHATEQKWDKGVSVKEYLMQKFEPGEEEKALSKVISEAISPTKKPGDKTVVEKVKGVVSSLLASNESSSIAIDKLVKSSETNKSLNIPATNKSVNITITNKSVNVPATNKSASMSVENTPASTIAVTNKSANMPATNKSHHLPVSSNAYEIVEEKTEGRILQTN